VRATIKGHETKICSPVRAIRIESDGDGVSWTIAVQLTDQWGRDKEIAISIAEAATDVGKALYALVDACLMIHCPQTPLFHRLIIDMLLKAKDVLLGRRLRCSGWFINKSKNANGDTEEHLIFAHPNSVGKGGNVEFRWGGQVDKCRVSQAGTSDGWRREVCKLAEGNMVSMVALGVGLAPPAIKFMPARCESNTVAHVFDESSSGKTISECVGATAFGKGAPTSVPNSFLESWSATHNGLEGTLAAHNFLPLFLDELKNLSPQAAIVTAYAIAGGVGKTRMTVKIDLRRTGRWNTFAFSSGELSLSERANEGSFRKTAITDAGVQARVVSLRLDDDLFPSLHSHSNSLAIVDALTKSCVTHYGHAGPAFVQWLIDHQDEARDRLEKILDVWNASCVTLVEGAHAQAHRVMSRLGSIAIGAALAADVLGFDWDCCTSPEINAAVGEHLGNASRSMMWAYRDFLAKWLKQNGVDKASGASTQILEGVEELKSYFLGFPAHFPIAKSSMLRRRRPSQGSLRRLWRG
jgi:putative DNA primase/helicase